MATPAVAVGRLGDTYIHGENFPLTAPGVNAALQVQASRGGGRVYVPNADIPLTETIVIPNRVWLYGEGEGTKNRYTFRGAGIDLPYGITNEDHDGTQHFMGIRDLSIDGQKGNTQIDHLIYVKSVFIGSEVKNVYLTDSSGNGLTVDGGGHPKPGTRWTKNPDDPVLRAGPLNVEHAWSINNNGYNFEFTGSVDIQGRNLTSEKPAPGKGCVYFVANMAMQATASTGSVINGLHMEGDEPTADGLVMDGLGAVLVSGIHWGGRALRAVVVLRNETGVSAYPNHAPPYVCDHIQLQQVSTGTERLLIDDQINGVQVIGQHRNYYTPSGGA